MDDVYISHWFAFKHMQFLMDKFKPRKTIDNVSSVTHGSPDDVEDINLNDSKNENTTAQDKENPAKQGQKSHHDMQLKNTTKSDKKRQRQEDPRIDEAYSILKDSLAQKTRDESTVFGEHVANKHRKYNSKIRSIVEHKINDILFLADMGYLSQSSYHQASQSPHGSTYIYSILHILFSTKIFSCCYYTLSNASTIAISAK
ncbi:unnamed protein product [Psylliodes chrysocephalus]|uniref:Uncharacterized protein n=1 Tax=Psylliodes chrysocephalus TaxID=3402493 RepID=A0A9P0CJJ9_9CUCU|nr:unnamed protein product [Psylliodes chrysocephala]